MRHRYEYLVAGVLYPSQASLERKVKEHLAAAPIDAEFYDPFLAAVVNGHHPEVLKAGQRASGRFRYIDQREQARLGLAYPDRYRGGKVVLAYFEPLGDWRDCTVYPWRGHRNIRSDIKDALRQKINERLPRRRSWEWCVRPGCRILPVEYQHVAPTFDQIAEACLALMSSDEIETKFGYSKFAPGRGELCDLMPNDHPAIVHLFEAHTKNVWEWLCAYHHRNVQALRPDGDQESLL